MQCIFLFLSAFFVHELLCLKSNIFVSVNNAGTINKNKKTWDVPVEEFDVVIDTNLKRVVNILSHFFPLIIER